MRELSRGQSQPELCLIYGRAQGRYGSHTVDILWDWKRLRGRIGGMVDGKKLDLSYDFPRLHGQLGGSIAGSDVRGTVKPESIEVKLDDGPEDAFSLTLTHGRAEGHYGGEKHGQPISLNYDRHRVRGYIGTLGRGTRISLEHNAPEELAVLCAVVAHKVVKDQVMLIDTSLWSLSGSAGLPLLYWLYRLVF